MVVSTSKSPTFSFIVAAYNVEDWVDACLHSLLVDEMQDCEIIVVNDGSTDGTLARIERYADDPRLVIVDQANGGLGDARNTGIKAARGDYLMFVDGDDWVEPHTVRSFKAALSEQPEADLLVFGFYEVYGEQRYPNPRIADFWQMTNSACNKLFHRSLFDNLGFDSRIWYEDLALVPVLFARADHPRTLDAILYNYRRDRETSIMNTIDFERNFDLLTAASRCLARIHADEASGRTRPMTERFGEDWEARFITVEIFIPGVLHRARQISKRDIRRRYIAEMMQRFPDRRAIRPHIVGEKYGRKMRLGSALYRRGQDRAAHWLLHDTGAVRQWGLARLGR